MGYSDTVQNVNSPFMQGGRVDLDLGEGGADVPGARRVDQVDESSKSAWYLFLLTVSIGG